MGWQKRKNPETVGQAILGTYFSSLASVSWFMSACVHAKSLQSCLTLWDTMDHSLLVSSLLCDSPGKNTGVGCHALLQGIFPTQGLNPSVLCIMHWQACFLSLAPPGKPIKNNNVSHIFNESPEICYYHPSSALRRTLL